MTNERFAAAGVDPGGCRAGRARRRRGGNGGGGQPARTRPRFALAADAGAVDPHRVDDVDQLGAQPPSDRSEPNALELAALEPTTVEPTTVEPATVEPATVEPTALEPTAVEPTADVMHRAAPAAGRLPAAMSDPNERTPTR